jgi:hypothetical protein
VASDAQHSGRDAIADAIGVASPDRQHARQVKRPGVFVSDGDDLEVAGELPLYFWVSVTPLFSTLL